MPEKIINVMISSTIVDMPKHREQVREACLRLGMFPLMAESRPASDVDAISLSMELVDRADIYVGVFAHRYGYIPSEENPRQISIVEMEYVRAVNRGIPRLIFVTDEKYPLTPSDVEQGAGAKKLRDFLNRVRKTAVASFFKSPQDLRNEVISALSTYRDAGPGEPLSSSKQPARKQAVKKQPVKKSAAKPASQPKETPSAEQPGDISNAPDPAQATPTAINGESALIPFTGLSEFNLSRSLREIIDTATGPSYRGAPLTTTTLFFALIQEGGRSDTYSITSNFLKKLVDQSPGSSSRFDQLMHAYLAARGTTVARSRKGSASMTREALITLEKAREFAEKVEPDVQIYPRHLLASLIHRAASGDRIGFKSRLEQLEIPLETLRREFLTIPSVVQAKNQEIWNEFLGGMPEAPRKRVSRLTGFQADDAKGETDWLDIDPDVNAFAALIASRTISPPMSIGLFGEWGSGKTFFMRRLKKRINHLALTARDSDKMQRDLPFYKRIAQIEFNAWHYVESNLWASLVEHIFSNLYISEESDVLKLQESLFKKLGVEKTDLAEAEAKREAAQKDLENKAAALTSALNRFNEEQGTLRSVRLTDVLDTLKISDPVLKESIEKLLSDFNIDLAGNAVRSVKGSLDQARAIVERGNTLLNSLVKAKDRKWRFGWLVLCLAIPLILGLLLAWLRSSWNAQLVSDGIAILGGIATTLIAVVTWIARQASWVSGWLREAERVNQKIEAKIDEKNADLKKEIIDQERLVENSRIKYEDAVKAKDEAERRLSKAREEVKNATAERLLSKFVQDRVASDDYRKHLGVLALVRNDFEKLSNYIEEQNWRLSPADPGEPENKKPFERFPSLNDEKTDQATRINRIVLYIDDLDRCPPNKVVDVLQAVHLLLAFPLFVVVVGVDARWVTRSLESRYKELLHNSQTGGALAEGSVSGTASESLIGAATPDDYLEKIFQIPFWLNPMDQQSRVRMVGGLLKQDVVRNEGPVAETAPAAVPETGPDNDGGLSGSDHRIALDSREEPSDTPPASITPPLKDESETAGQKSDFTEENLMEQQKLEIHQSEIDSIEKLSLLLGRSPRALKRFVNLYRLIKVGLSEDESSSFASGDTFTNSDAVLFLLAIDTGLPLISQKVFAYFSSVHLRMSQNPDWTPPPDDTHPSRVELENDRSGEWQVVKDWFNLNYLTDPIIMGRIGSWVPRVTRFSFHARKG